MAPEIITNKRYSSTSDVYAFSLTVFEMFIKNRPFTNLHIFHLLSEVRNGKWPEITYNTEILQKNDTNKNPLFEDILSNLMIDPGFFEESVNHLKSRKFHLIQIEKSSTFSQKKILLTKDSPLN